MLLCAQCFIYGATITLGYVAASGMAGEYGIINKWEGGSRGQVEVLSRNFPVFSDENHENPES
jgi:hypothetical protein